MPELRFGLLDGDDNVTEEVSELVRVLVRLSEDVDADADLKLPGKVLAVHEDQCLLECTTEEVEQLQNTDMIVAGTINPSCFIDEEGLLVFEEQEPTEIEPDLDSEDWFEKLEKDEIITDSDGKPLPKLAGLRRLAKPFIAQEDSRVNTVCLVEKEVKRTLKKWVADEEGKAKLVGVQETLGKDYYPYASVTFTIILKDGRIFTDSADAYLGNCNDLGNYPTAVASARAEGRVLRKVLGIKEHVFEEISSKDAIEELTIDEDNPIQAAQKKLIENLLSKVQVNLRETIEKITTRDVVSVDELTSAEAKLLIKILNEAKKKVKK